MYYLIYIIRRKNGFLKIIGRKNHTRDSMLEYTPLPKFIWAPRILTIAYIIFISSFAFDVFSMDAPIMDKFRGFGIHLAPSFIILITLFQFWRDPLSSGIAMIILSIISSVFFHTYSDVGRFTIITCPLVVTGILFIICYVKMRKMRKM